MARNLGKAKDAEKSCRVIGWRSTGRPVFEINSMARELTGNTVPVPKALLKLILSIVVPRVMSQKVQALLPVELGDYLSQAQQGVHVTGTSAPPTPPLGFPPNLNLKNISLFTNAQ